MSNINWETPFYLDLATGESSATAMAGWIAFPTFGHYGGGGSFSAGEFGGELITNPDGSPYSYKKLLKFGDDNQDPVDKLDYLFYRHDVLSAQAGPGYTQAQADADISLLKSLVKLDASYDAEASLYAGFASLGMIGDLAIHNDLDLLSPSLLIAALGDAAGDIEYGLDNLPPQELALVLGSIFEQTGPTTFAFDFSITTSSFTEEALEWVALNAVDAALDFGEGDPPLNTGFPFPGTSDYQLSYDVLTHDLDLLSA